MRTAGLSTQLATVTQEEDKMAAAVMSETSGGQDDMEETEVARQPGMPTGGMDAQ